MDDPQPISALAPDVQQRIQRLAARAAAGEIATSPEPASDAGQWLDRPEVPPAIPSRFAHARITQLTGELAHLAEDWTEATMSPNVVLLGNVGVGKTHAACALAIAAHQAGSTVQFAPVVELLDQLRPGGDEHALARAMTVDVLVLDDLGGERPTDWTGERMYALINRRWLEQRPTIATSNLGPAALEKAIGARAWSRLYHDALRLSVSGDDRRKTAA